jgi:hypothetical protein
MIKDDQEIRIADNDEWEAIMADITKPKFGAQEPEIAPVEEPVEALDDLQAVLTAYADAGIELSEAQVEIVKDLFNSYEPVPEGQQLVLKGKPKDPENPNLKEDIGAPLRISSASMKTLVGTMPSLEE